MNDGTITFDGGLPVTSKQCWACAHFVGTDNGKRVCKAFADIPATIWLSEFDHTRPYQGDCGVRFKKFLPRYMNPGQ